MYPCLKTFKVCFERVKGCVKAQDIENTIICIKSKYTFHNYMRISAFHINIKIHENLTTNVLIYIYILFFFGNSVIVFLLYGFFLWITKTKTESRNTPGPGVTARLDTFGIRIFFFTHSIIYYILFFLPPRSCLTFLL